MSPASTKELTSGASAIAAQPQEAVRTESPSSRLRSLICRSVCRICPGAFGRLKAIVLTGSLARDEATFTRIANSYTTFGDAEFLLVLERQEKLPSAASLDALRQRIEQDLLHHQVICRVDVSAVRPDYFRLLPPHIFSYELKHCGRVIWGEDDVLRAIPEYSAVDLSREDAARLLANRLIELLECAPEIAGARNSMSPTLHYKLLKLYLDMAASLLVFLRNYAPTYRERQRILSRLANHRARSTDASLDRQAFANCVTACTHWKLTTHEGPEVPPNLPWRQAVEAAHALLRWELIQLTDAHLSITDEELFAAWKRMQPRKANLRGWARVLRSCGWRRSFRQWSRWLKLCWFTAPRFGVYQAAFGLWFGAFGVPSSAPNETKSSISRLHRLLPILNHENKRSEPNEPLELATAIVANYREFLVGTRL
jgi:hypothetical protein